MRLLGKDWLPQNRASLQRLIYDFGSPAVNAVDVSTPSAVFVLDGVSVAHHAGEAAFCRLVTRAEFKFGEKFWEALPFPYRRRIRTGYENFHEAPPGAWPKDPHYQLYRKAFFEAYQTMCRTQGMSRCHAWLAGLLQGFQENAIAEYMQKTVAEEVLRPAGWEEAAGAVDDPTPVRFRVGLRPIPEMRELYATLLRHGFDVWVISSSNQWAAEALAAVYGVSPERVLGVRPKILDGALQPEIMDPVPEGVGGVEAIKARLDRGPVLVVGGGGTDKDLLGYGREMRLVIDRGESGFRDYALRKGWLVQPTFAPAEEEQKEQDNTKPW